MSTDPQTLRGVSWDEWAPSATVYTDDWVQLLHGDCREQLVSIPTNSVDLILTDPPYGINYVTNRVPAWNTQRKPLRGDCDLEALDDVLGHLQRVLKPDRHAYVFASPLLIGRVQDLLGKVWRVKQVLCFDKGDAGTVGDLTGGYAECWEAILFCVSGTRQMQNGRPRNIFRKDWSARRDPVHPTVKPVDILRWLILNSTQYGDVVLDPFAGSGTTLRACKDLGRFGIGIEIDRDWCEKGAERLRQEVLFTPDPVP